MMIYECGCDYGVNKLQYFNRNHVIALIHEVRMTTDIR